MNTITLTQKEIVHNAVKEMENCMAYLTIGDKMKATMAHGAASVWEDMALEFDVALDDREDPTHDEHYADMVDIWCEAIKNW